MLGKASLDVVQEITLYICKESHLLSKATNKKYRKQNIVIILPSHRHPHCVEGAHNLAH